MEPIMHSLKVLWRSERLLRQNEFRLGSRKIQFNALAGLVALFGLVMLSLSVFFVLVPYWGNALAALAVGGADLALAVALIAYARSLKPAEEVAMVTEMRDMALGSLEDEVARVESDLAALRNDLRRLIRNPADVLLPGIVRPLMGAVAGGLGSAKKRKEKN